MCVPWAIRRALAAAAIHRTLSPEWTEAQGTPALDPIAVRAAIAASGTINGPLASTFALMMQTRSPEPDLMLPVALGWRVLPLEGRDLYWHDAEDADGFSVYVAMKSQRHRMAAALGKTPHPVAELAGQRLLGQVPSIAAVPHTTPASKNPTPTRTRRRGQN